MNNLSVTRPALNFGAGVSVPGLIAGGNNPPPHGQVNARNAAKLPESPVHGLLQDIHAKFLAVREGMVASYIPELERVAPDQFGIALVTADGYLYEIGESRSPFTIQSISKPLIYGLALQDHGRDQVLVRIGVEPSGDQFNAIVFDDRKNRPFNAMVNTGAIATTSLVHGDDAAARWLRILELMRALSGRAAGIDEAVYRSEAATGHRNRAIAYLELNNGMIQGDVDAHLDLYFRQCAILTTAADLAFIAATLARGGLHPVTGERALAAENVRDVLSVMTTCGMYDYAGEWELRVGLPAKSGVGGGIMAVLPGQLGIGVFSPRLDEHGNSYRGIRVCEELARRLELHLLHYRGRARPAIRRTYRGSEVRSKRVRNAAAAARLDSHGAAIRAFELHGNLFFGNTEQAVRRILSATDVHYLILDLERVASVDAVASDLLHDLCQGLVAAGKTVKFAAVPQEVREHLELDPSVFAPSAENALEKSEDAVLCSTACVEAAMPVDLPLRDFELLAELDWKEIGILARHLDQRIYASGATIIEEGAPADSLYFLLGGSVDVCVIHGGDGTVTRLASIDAGNVFGELALLGNRPRTASVVAASVVRVLELRAAEFTAMLRDNPEIRAKLLSGVGRSLSERLRRANAVIRSLTR